ncbi:hypothetical protein Sipo8835_09030 [Streptomyces ipomoeae]|uniref:Sortase n=2 Tax=Streptomyces ipomoeae TaxID=103232 RepID=A0AAE8W4U3_9ACTN|nr:hypothetical protein [Streptomyces ipomoeae]MDX2698499.1 hypothetical protein [Streptomyces ipomoeae]MDX2825785.1 hypothetical protein [Streptomyces ipomoeae]MDX2844183.1 hypothetical protein [Streptomyces ipomoeae]MDX2880888.1 hypothetical protein [Streptomyces ipomoeae]TQE36964.1 hypothetical protein Sipo8835_09030 [Streptomyces ipomoeae]
MRRSALPLTGTALAVVVAALAVAPAYGGENDGRLELSPARVVPGDEVTVRTAACGADGTAAGDASAVGAGPFPLAPDVGQRLPSGRFEVPPSAQPGTYEIVATCTKGGRRIAGDLVVSLTGAAQSAPMHPRGSVKTGVGGALGPDPVQTAAGVAALAVAAAGGTWLLHRRARGDGI